ncbi:unnamed protein product, partial [Nezara viridula]
MWSTSGELGRQWSASWKKQRSKLTIRREGCNPCKKPVTGHPLGSEDGSPVLSIIATCEGMFWGIFPIKSLSNCSPCSSILGLHPTSVLYDLVDHDSIVAFISFRLVLAIVTLPLSYSDGLGRIDIVRFYRSRSQN